MEKPAVIKIDVESLVRQRLPRYSRFIPRGVFGWLKNLICQEEMNRLLDENAGKTGAEFCEGILRSLSIDVTPSGPCSLPPSSERRVVFVCNHPLGGLDGMALIDMVHRHYGGQVWFVVNDLLMAVKPLENVFLPINKFGAQQRASFRRIEEAFAGNDPILIFPAGLVSRLRNVTLPDGSQTQTVRDLEWKKMFVQKSVQYRRDIVPLYFSGTNSADFYRKARLRKRLGIKFNVEMVLLPREMIAAKGSRFTVRVGAPVSWREVEESSRTATGMAETVKRFKNAVYSLASEAEETNTITQYQSENHPLQPSC